MPYIQAPEAMQGEYKKFKATELKVSIFLHGPLQLSQTQHLHFLSELKTHYKRALYKILMVRAQLILYSNQSYPVEVRSFTYP